LENKSYKDFYEKLSFEILENYGFSELEKNSILKRKKELKVKFIEDKLGERNVEIIICDEDNFPVELKNIPNSPYFIYVR
jgi:predicted Rossmann fold nucleotide-binding protein DprA/Smf involved in DNA uptake